jgi:hypothetical protein
MSHDLSPISLNESQRSQFLFYGLRFPIEHGTASLIGPIFCRTTHSQLYTHSFHDRYHHIYRLGSHSKAIPMPVTLLYD